LKTQKVIPWATTTLASNDDLPGKFFVLLTKTQL